jgi:predicted amidohydrolase
MNETGSPAEAPVRIACIQMEPRVGHKPDNVARSLAQIEAAAAAGAQLAVLLELCSSGYVFECCATGARTSTTRCSARTSIPAGVNPGWY